MVSYNNPKENTTADPGFPIGQGVPTYDTVAFRQKMGWAGVGAGTAGAGAGAGPRGGGRRKLLYVDPPPPLKYISLDIMTVAIR